jgi:lipoyl(octanoyl) transferase
VTGVIMLDVVDLGELRVPAFVAAQDEAVKARLAGICPDTLLVTRHPATVTYPGPARPYLLIDDVSLDIHGIERVRVVRGGSPLYLDPGYLCLCPVADIGQFGGAADYPGILQGITIRALQSLGVPARARVGWTGVWLHNDLRLATIGVAVRRNVSSFGVFLNVAADLGLCAVVPKCGSDCGSITSLEREYGARRPSSADVVSAFASAWQEETTRG